VGYNVQVAVETKHHLIITHEVTNVGTDRSQLSSVAKAVPGLVAGPCLLNVVRRGKTLPIELNAAEAMGYKLAILPTLLFRGVIGCCEELLSELKTGVFPARFHSVVSPACRGEITSEMCNLTLRARRTSTVARRTGPQSRIAGERTSRR